MSCLWVGTEHWLTEIGRITELISLICIPIITFGCWTPTNILGKRTLVTPLGFPGSRTRVFLLLTWQPLVKFGWSLHSLVCQWYRDRWCMCHHYYPHSWDSKAITTLHLQLSLKFLTLLLTILLCLPWLQDLQTIVFLNQQKLNKMYLWIHLLLPLAYIQACIC